MNKLHNKDFSIAFKTGTDANKSKFKKECVQGEIYHATDTGFFYVAEVTAGASDATLSKFGGAAFNTYSVDFDGTNDYVITSASLIDYDDMANGYTFSGWMWREDVPSLPSNGGTTSWFGGPYASANTGAPYPYLRWYLVDEYYAGTVYKIIRWYHGTQIINNTVTLIPKGTWSHLAVTWDGSNTATTYLNGSQLDQITNASSLPSRSDKMLIGKGEFQHKGKVDEVAYWNQGLSSSDITAIYNSGTPDDLTSYSPVGWWRMGDNDGGTGTTITDQGSGGNDGTLVNGPTFSTDVP
jgi:hypothetical protein